MTAFRNETFSREDEGVVIQSVKGDWQFNKGNTFEHHIARQSDDERLRRLELIRAAAEGRK